MEGKEIRDILSKNLKKFRTRRRWSQANLAEFAGISPNFLGGIERGIQWPHPDTLAKLAKALGIMVYELFLEEAASTSIDTQTRMDRFLNDVSSTLNKSLPLAVKQSIENVQKHYKLDKNTKLPASPPDEIPAVSYKAAGKNQKHRFAAEKRSKKRVK